MSEEEEYYEVCRYCGELVVYCDCIQNDDYIDPGYDGILGEG